ncbi:hypothetical protein [Lacticaseibacillus rhamnosus]|uniref:hypothetical protein n=1 Tax=Lacticaseibacillus rhamnosus TaxID=47715 RepID=UPI00237F0A87|nr:hypothetical protein [Lacticaseibacillus rhamnosus]MDE3295896.1 hypothetical protein [Lacticaseibacillus rhamnosus]
MKLTDKQKKRLYIFIGLAILTVWHIEIGDAITIFFDHLYRAYDLQLPGRLGVALGDSIRYADLDFFEQIIAEIKNLFI